MVSRVICSQITLGLALLYCPVSVTAQPEETPASRTKKGSFTNPVKAGSLGQRPAAGSLTSGRPKAGSLTVGKPAAGSLSSGRPAAGSMATGVVGGSLARPLGERTGTGSLATRQRRLNSSDDTTSTRSERRERLRQSRRRD